jgi:hypothetical protein
MLSNAHYRVKKEVSREELLEQAGLSRIKAKQRALLAFLRATVYHVSRAPRDCG